MPNIDVVDMQGKKVGSMELSEEIFAATVNVPAMHLVVRSILPISVRAPRAPSPAAWVAAAAGRFIARRAPVMPAIMATALPSSVTAAWFSLPSLAITW